MTDNVEDNDAGQIFEDEIYFHPIPISTIKISVTFIKIENKLDNIYLD